MIVPKADLDKVEESRKQLYELLKDHCENTGFLMELTSITEPLWKVANKRYPQAKV